MVIALVLFIVASVLCAIAPTVLLLAAARVLQGLGGGGLMALSQALVGEAVPPRQRGHYQGYLSAVVTASSAFGPVAGGFLTEQFGWQSVFLVNVPLGLLALVLTFRLPSVRVARQAAFQFDWGGLVFFTAFIVPILLALERLQQFDRSAVPTIAALIALSLASLVTLLILENRQASPLIPIVLLRQKAIWSPSCRFTCGWCATPRLPKRACFCCR
jgi:MFS family permease